MKKSTRNHRREAIFQRWLQERRFKRFKESLTEFTIRCDAGEIEGLGFNDFAVPERSDTVSSPTQRDDTPIADSSSGTAGEQPETVEPHGWGFSEPPPF